MVADLVDEERERFSANHGIWQRPADISRSPLLWKSGSLCAARELLNLGGFRILNTVYVSNTANSKLAVSRCFYWSGRGDLNARPPAPKTDSGEPAKLPIFNSFCFKQMRPSYCDLLGFVVCWGFGSYVFVYSGERAPGSLAMIQEVEAVYEHGVLRPLRPLSLAERQQVRLTISDAPAQASERDIAVVERARLEAAKLGTAPTIEEVRAALASIPGSLSHDVIAERGDYWLSRYFFDTSAIVKYFHTEPGTAEVSRIFAEPDRKIAISSIGLVEIQSAIAIKVRSGTLDQRNAGIQRARLMLDVAASEIEVYRLSDQHLEAAELLIGRHSFTRRLRTLDALQLAVALDLSRQNSLDHFVVADQALAEIASLEGLAVINPEMV
jgi:predicted DNA-binding antitoxin AbrB/MazE fold protein/predicted nucleic acid-binding protein